MFEKCVCSKFSNCNDLPSHRREFTYIMKKINDLKKDRKELKCEMKVREDYIEGYVIKNRRLRKEKYSLKNKYLALEDESQDLKNEVNLLRECLREKELSLEYQTNQLNQCRAEYSKVNQKYLMLCVLKSQAEWGNVEKENATTSDFTVQIGGKSPPSSSKQATLSNSGYSSGLQRLASANNAENGRPSASHLTSNATDPFHSHNKSKQQDDEDKIQCPICMKAFSKKSALACHQRVHSKRKQKSVVNEVETNEEASQPLPIDDLQCPICFRICVNACGLASHRRSHSKEQITLQTDSVGEVVHSNRDTPRPLPQAKELQCPECFKICLNACGLANHRRSHSKGQDKSAAGEVLHTNENSGQPVPPASELQCPECFKICRNACGLANHRRSHSKEVPKNAVNENTLQPLPQANDLQCPECFKICRNACGLASHRRSHSKQLNKGSVTEGCDITPRNDQENEEPQSNKSLNRQVIGKLATRNKLKNQQQGNRTSNGKEAKRSRCKECNKIFYFPSQLREHENMHMGKKPFSCGVCFKSFSYRASAYTHSLTHSAFRAHKCPECKYSFTQLAHLRRHMVVHQRSNFKFHRCYLCGASFVSSIYLKNHMRRIHFQQTNL